MRYTKLIQSRHLQACCINMIYGSVCSGIEAATVAWRGLGWKAGFFSEIEKFPRAVLSHHFPRVPLHGDFTTILEQDYGPIDILVGGTPCQSFSVAGQREGLDDERGNLAIEYINLAARKRAEWLVWENVPGILSSWSGHSNRRYKKQKSDFSRFIEKISELGYGYAYRTFDAQYFGVPQRRRRIFVVAYLGDWRPAAAVLFERESLRRDTPPLEKEKQNVAGTITSSIGRSRGAGQDPAGLVAFGGNNTAGQISVATAVNASGSRRYDFESETFVVHGTQDPDTLIDVAHTLGRNHGQENALLVFDTTQITSTTNRSQPVLGKPCHTLNANAHPPTLASSEGVRRLTPLECERLQGFPDNWTQIPWRGKPADQCPDSPRYRSIGNSMAVPVMRWIGGRINLVNKILAEN